MLKSIPSITTHQVFSFRSDFQKYFPVRSKNQNQESIDRVESSIKHRMKIPILDRKEITLYKYHHNTSEFESITFNPKKKLSYSW